MALKPSCNWIFQARYGDRASALRSLLRLPDKEYVTKLFHEVYGRDPDLVNPTTFDEKIQWYKLYYRRTLMTELTDKFRVRDWLQRKELGYILNELYGVYDRFDPIPFEQLPAAFVLKANHGCGWNIICRDKRELDLEAARTRMEGWLQLNYFYKGREWSYKDIQPRIICEKYLENEEFGELIDYKFYCYGGAPEVVFVCCGRFSPGGVRYDAYDMDWNRIPVFKGKPAAGLDLPRPPDLKSMQDIARQISEGFPFIRVDLYSVAGRIIFGEVAFYPDSGRIPFTPDAYNRFFGDLFQLPAEPVLE